MNVLRQTAKDEGLKRYTPIGSCSKGHQCDRYVCDNQCVECCRIKLVERYRKNPEKERDRRRRYVEQNKDKLLTKAAIKRYLKRIENPELITRYEKVKQVKLLTKEQKLEKERKRQREKQRKAYEENPEKLKARSKAYRTKTPEKISEHREKCREYKRNNPEVIRNLNFKHNAKDRAARLRRVPHWLSNDDLQKMRDIYKEAREKGLQVDHIIPLQGKNVSGLHTPSNLQLLTRSENASKKNFYEII